MNTVWMVTSGEYSDYGVVAIYSNQDVAKRAAAVAGSWRTHSNVDIQEMQIHDDIDLTTEVSYKVPRVRRAGSPTVSRDAKEARGACEEFKRGQVMEGKYHRGLSAFRVGPPTANPIAGWVYYGTDEPAVAACARAQSMAWHGEVVEHEDNATTPSGMRMLDPVTPP